MSHPISSGPRRAMEQSQNEAWIRRDQYRAAVQAWQLIAVIAGVVGFVVGVLM